MIAVPELAPFVGVVLSGGASSRMGRDKATIPWRTDDFDGDLLHWAVARLCQVAEAEDVVVADGGRDRSPQVPSVDDGPGSGPAAGILGAAREFPGRPLLVLACDLPMVPVDLLRRLTSLDGDWVVPVSPRDDAEAGLAETRLEPLSLEPLCAVYRPVALEALGRRVAAGRMGLHGLARTDGLRVRTLSIDESARFGDPRRLFTNVNRPDDLETVQTYAGTFPQPADGR